MMKFTSNEVFEITVFDENENMVANLNTLKESKLYYDEDSEGYYIIVNDSLYDYDLLKFLNTEKSISDFKAAKNGRRTTLSVGKKKVKKCKLIAKVTVRNVDLKDQLLTFECENAEVSNSFNFDLSFNDPSSNSLVFKLMLDDEEEFFKIHFNQ